MNLNELSDAVKEAGLFSCNETNSFNCLRITMYNKYNRKII